MALAEKLYYKGKQLNISHEENNNEQSCPS